MANIGHHYLVCGLRIASPRSMQGAVALDGGAIAPDVTVAFEDVPLSALDGDAIADEFSVSANGDVACKLRNGRMLISGGERISLDIDGEASDAWLSSTVFGLAMSVILHQRNSLPMHCCCVARDSGAILLFGDTGAGKSTSAFLLAERGWTILAEDIAALEFDADGAVNVVPSSQIARFWDESADGVCLDSFGPPMAEQAFPKRIVLTGGERVLAPARLRAAYFLEWLHPSDGPAEIARMSRLEALVRLRGGVYRSSFVAALGLERTLNESLGRIAASVPCFVLRRPRSFDNLAWLDRLGDWEFTN